MAHLINIPIKYEFFSPASEWYIVQVRAIAIGQSEEVLDTVSLEVVAPEKFLGLTQAVPIGWLPREIKKALSQKGVRFPPEIRSIEFPAFVTSYGHRGLVKLKKVDPWEIRREILCQAFSFDPPSFLRILNKYGAWSRLAQPTKDSADKWVPRIVTTAELAADCAWCWRSLLDGPWYWFEKNERGEEFSPPAKFSFHYMHTDQLCMDAITTSITVDFLRGTRFHSCRRSDCRAPFAARRGKVFCSQPCAHLDSVRRKRGTVRGLI